MSATAPSEVCCVVQDMGELEAGVGQALYPLHSLGLPFSMVRALRRLIFMDTAEILTSPILRELPASIVLHHLYSRAPASLPSPHVRHSFTAAQVRPPSLTSTVHGNLSCYDLIDVVFLLGWILSFFSGDARKPIRSVRLAQTACAVDAIKGMAIILSV